jgi:hypothetical protein
VGGKIWVKELRDEEKEEILSRLPGWIRILRRAAIEYLEEKENGQ